jgi:deoxyribose-phosphate aldolase
MAEPLTVRSLARMIDHALLHPTLTDAGILEGCEVARRWHTATVCVKPYSIPMCRDALLGSDVLVCSVIGFPHGNGTTTVKVMEAEAAVVAGAPEIDMVVNVGKVLGGDRDYVAREIRLVNEAVMARGGVLKVIFENDYLEESQIVSLCEICSEAEVAFVKTSTGYGFVKQPDGSFATRGATEAHVRLMRAHCAPGVQIKAAGGIRTLDDLLRMRELGATRCGASATREIMEEAQRRGIQ